MSSDATVHCPQCGEPAERIRFLFGDPASQSGEGKRTFECENEDCWQARIIRSVDAGNDRQEGDQDA